MLLIRLCQIFILNSFFLVISKILTKPIWLSGLGHLSSHQEVLGLRTGLTFFSFKFFKIVQFFNFSAIYLPGPFSEFFENLEFIPINFIGFKVPLAQFWSLGCVKVTYYGVDSHCDMYSGVRNKHTSTLINFWGFFHGPRSYLKTF